jgi:hypothetical protein
MIIVALGKLNAHARTPAAMTEATRMKKELSKAKGINIRAGRRTRARNGHRARDRT